MILIKMKENKLKSASKKGKSKEERWLKIIKFLKKTIKKKIEKNEAEMWTRLRELNNEFKNIKELKKI